MSHRTVRTLLLVACAFAAVLAFPTSGMARSHGDRNGDRIPDRWERAHHLSLKVNQAKRDQDHDGLRNRAEFMAGDNPRDADTDDDGIEDGQEKAGHVVSFTGGILTIHLFNGDDGTDAPTVTIAPPPSDSGEGSGSSGSGSGSDGSGSSDGDGFAGG